MDERKAKDIALVLCHVDDDGSLNSSRRWLARCSSYFMGMTIYISTWVEVKRSSEFQEAPHWDNIIALRAR